MAEWVSLATGIKTVVDLAKAVLGIAKPLGKTELVSKVLELQEAALDAQGSLQQAEQENLDLRKRNDALEQALKWKEELEFDTDDQAYRLKLKPDAKNGRFCATCWLGPERRITPLIAKDNVGELFKKIGLRDYSLWYCPACDKWSRRASQLAGH